MKTIRLPCLPGKAVVWGCSLFMACSLFAAEAQKNDTHSVQHLHRVARELLPRLGLSDPPGQVLLSEGWDRGEWGNRWKPDAGWSVERRPEGDGFCAQVVSSSRYQNLALKQPVSIEPGHPVAVFWRARLLAGSAPVWLSVGSTDAEGRSAGGRQEILRQGREWTDCAVLVSDWCQATNVRQLHLKLFQDPLCNTTALIDDFKVVDLHQATLEFIRSRMLKLQTKKLEVELNRFPNTPVAQWWKQRMATHCRAMRKELDEAPSLNPASLQALRPLREAEQSLTRFREIADGIRRGAVRHTRLTGFATRPITARAILPDTVDLPGASLEGLHLTAAPGEFESASLVLWAPETLARVLPAATDLKGPAGTIPADHVQIKWVKCWWQSGSAPRGHAQDLSRKVLVPELLLNDDDLVRVDLDSQRNTLRLSFPEGERYVAIDKPQPRRKAGFSYPLEEFPVKDSPRLLPATLPAKQNKQVWITIKVPPSTRPGRYAGTLQLTAESDLVLEVPLSVEVYPFSLPSPRTHYDPSREYTGSIYYWGELDPGGSGSVGHKKKSETQFRAELEMLRDHNLVAPTMIWSPALLYRNDSLLRRHLAILRELGMAGRPLTTGDSGTVGNPTEQQALAQLQDNVRKVIRAAVDHGFTGVYFYGLDEAKGDVLHSQKKAWQAVREAGGKVMTSGSLGMVPEFGPILDLINNNMPAPSCEAAGWHHHGRLVWNYGNPQSVVEDPEMFRRNYGLFNWRHDLDGTCTYCFIPADGSPWNDFDFVMRDHSLAYPTIDGVIGTLALAGLREGLDDVKYASALGLRIKEASRAGSSELKAQADAARTWLEDLDLNTADLDVVRQAIAKRIRQLDRGPQTASPSSPAPETSVTPGTEGGGDSDTARELRRLNAAAKSTEFPIAIAANGKSDALIVVSARAGSHERRAAEDLAKYIGLMCGDRPDIASSGETISAAMSGKTPVLVVGEEALKAMPELREALRRVVKKKPHLRTDGIVLRRQGNRVYLAGNNDLSHYLAVAELLRRWGCRWYMPTKFGECIPERRNLKAGDLDYAYSSPFEIRSYWISWLGDGSGAVEFQMRNMMTGRSELPPTGHALGKYTKGLGKGTFSFPITAPETARHVAEQVEKTYAEGGAFSLGMEDGSYDSDYPGDVKLMKLQWDKYFMRWSVTDPMLELYNNVASILQKKHPSSNGKIGFLAYANMTIPPVRNMTAERSLYCELAPIDIDPIHGMDDPQSPPRQEYKEMMYQWARLMQGRLCIYDYDQGMMVWRDIPNPSHQSFRQDVKHYRKAGILGVNTESRNAIATTFINLYLRARLLWNPDEDVDALLAEFYPVFYGPAAEPMSVYWSAIFKAWEDTIVTEHEHFIAPAIYTPELLAVLGKNLHEAEEIINRIKHQDRPLTRNEQLYVQRLQFTRFSHDITAGYMSMVRAAATECDYAKAVAAGEKALAVREQLTDMSGIFTTYRKYKVEDRGYAWWPGEVRQYRELLPLIDGTEGKLIVKLPINWAFHRDPGRQGLKRGYHTKPVDLSYWNAHKEDYDLDGLKNYPVDQWEMLRVDLYAQAQGIRHPDRQSFTGDMWYRTEVQLTAGQARGAVHLRFPGLFNECWLYVNGRLVAHREQGKLYWLNDYRFEWDVDLAGKLEAGKNTVCLRCNCDHHFGGMFRRPFLYRKITP